MTTPNEIKVLALLASGGEDFGVMSFAGMLYDPKWEVKAKPKTRPPVLSLAGLIAWLETQPPETEYSYTDIHDCLLMRYVKANGYRWAYGGVGSFNYSRFFLLPLFVARYPSVLDKVANAGRNGATYGDALQRARHFALSE